MSSINLRESTFGSDVTTEYVIYGRGFFRILKKTEVDNNDNALRTNRIVRPIAKNPPERISRWTTIHGAASKRSWRTARRANSIGGFQLSYYKPRKNGNSFTVHVLCFLAI